MPLGRLKKYLDDNKIKYVIKSHSIGYTAPEIAALAHIPGKELAKTVIIKIDDKNGHGCFTCVVSNRF